MNWTRLKVSCNSKDLEEICAIMSMLDPNLQIEDYSDIEEGLNTIYGDLIDESLKNADRTHSSVSLYIGEDKTPGDYAAFVRERVRVCEIDAKVELESVDDEDWETAWRKYYKPLHIGDRVTIVPAWMEYDAHENEITVLMDPGLAFGSGTHETTQLCAALIEKYMKKSARVLDVGTGSGILAIMEKKLGAESVDATDIDPIAVRVAKENAEINETPDINCFVSDLLNQVKCEEGEYDFISANIVADIIIRMAPDLPRVTKPGSMVACSGIIDERAADVMETMEQNGFAVADVISLNGWKGILFKRVK